MKKFFAVLGIINWKTTVAGIGSLGIVLGVILNAWRTKDFATILTQSQTLLPIITGILVGLGLLAAKDSTVTGVGTQAATVNETGKLVTVDDKIVGQQPPA
jgi:hypothetical protein